MNKLKMAAVQERLKLKRVQIDTWTTREKLCLASAVLRSGDQNWVSVSRTLRSFDELNRPPDWFSQKNCALQYSSLLEKVDTPKRKRGEKGEVHVETPSESIVRKLTSERVEELKKSIEYKRMLHRKLQDEIALVKSGKADDKLDEMLQEIEDEKSQKKKEAELHAQWLKEREEKLLEIKRAWRPPATSSSSTTSSSHKQRDSEGGIRRSSSQSDQSSEPESLEDSPLSSEPMQVDVIGDESLEGQADTKPSSPVRESSPKPTSALLPCTTTTATPTSPLLTSLLKSPTQAPSSQASSILHSAITAQRGTSPTITSLLNSSPGIPVTSAGAVSPTVSVGIKSLVTSVLCSSLSEDNADKKQQPAPSTSPSAGAPTLSMLLELPPSLPGKPLPEIPSVPHKVPSTPTKENPPSTPPASPPPFSPLPAVQDNAHNQPESIAPTPKEEEKTQEETTKEITALEIKEEPEVCEERVDISVKVEEESDTVNDPEPKSEKSDGQTLSPEDANVVPEPPPVNDETKESSPVQPDKHADEAIHVSHTSPVTSEVLEETADKSSITGEAVDKKSTDAIKNDVTESLTEPPCTQSPDFVEVPAAVKPELTESELNQEPPESPKPNEEVVCPDSVNKDEINGKLPEKDIPKAINDPPAIEESKDSAEYVPEVSNAEVLPDSDSVIEVETKDASDNSKEKIIGVSDKEDILHPAHDEKLDEEASLPEPVSLAKKEESISQTAVEEDVGGRSPSKESISTPDAPSSDPQTKRRGGGRWRKSRGRSLAMYRFNQEKMAKTKIDKEPEIAGESEEIRDLREVSEASAKDNPLSKEVDVGKEKTETKKVKSSGDEISDLKKEWDDSTNDAAVEEEKMEITSSQKKLKNRKSEEVSGMENEQKDTTLKRTEACEVTVKDVRDKFKKDVEGDLNSTVVQELSEPDANKKSDVKSVTVKEVEKQQSDTPVEKRHPEKVSEKKKEEVATTEPPDPEKVTHEKRAEERRTSTDKKAIGKAKPIAIDKKVEEKRRLKEPERKERKVDEDKEEVVTKEESTKQTPKEEEKKGVVGKDKRTEGKERKSLLEKRSESGQDRKPSRERRVEEKEEKNNSSEKVIADKEKVKELDAKKSDSEKKISSREKKSEERERKATLERKVEESKRKSVDEKKKEELVRSKSADRESTVSLKKNAGASTPEKSKIPASRPAMSVSSSGRHKRKSGSVEDDDSSLEEPITQSEPKKTKQQAEGSTTADAVGETRIGVDLEKKQIEEMPNKRKMDKRRFTLSKRIAETEDNASRGSSATPMDEREKVTEGEANPKQSAGRKRGTGSVSVSSAPGTPLDQVPHSPASSGSVSEEERDYRAWKKAILLVWSRLATHKFASIFLRPITNDQAPGYHNVVFRPVDLYTIKKNVENGVIRTTAHFQRDVMLMFLNAIMYNASDHDVHRMSLQMQQESLQHIQILLEAQEAPKILRRETREGNKRSDSSSQMQMTPNPSQDELPVGAPVISSHTPAENAISNMSEEEMSECDYPLSYCLSTHKDGHCDDSSGKNMSPRVLPDQFHKDDYSDEIFKKNVKVEREQCIPQSDNNESAVDRSSSAENSNASDIDDDKMELCMRSSHSTPKKKGITKKKERKQNSTYQSSDPYADVDLGDDQLNYSQYGDLELSNPEMEKKQGLKRPLNDVLMSSDDSSSIPEDGGDWSNVMSIKEEKADDSESVSSSFYKRRRVQRKSTNSDPESLLDAPTFPFSSNFASLEESDYQAWKKFVLMVWDQIADHEFATIFMTPVRTDEAPRYYNVVFRPMDLGTIRKNVEKGLVRTISHFQRDVILMLTNAIMYNPSHHDVHQKTAQMQKECLQFLQMLVTESSEDPEVFRHEIRESNNKICSTGLEELLPYSKSESQSDEDQITSISTSGNLLSNIEKHSSLNGNACEEGDGSSMQKSLSFGEKPTKIFSKKRRTLDSA